MNDILQTCECKFGGGFSEGKDCDAVFCLATRGRGRFVSNVLTGMKNGVHGGSVDHKLCSGAVYVGSMRVCVHKTGELQDISCVRRIACIFYRSGHPLFVHLL